MQRWIVILALVVVAAIGGALALNFARPAKNLPTISSAITIGGAFTLIDHDGRTVTDADYRGRHALVFFGYTYCPDVCPTTAQNISDAMDLLGSEADQVQPLFVSVDPGRDTAEVLKSYVGNFHPRMIGLTGSAEQVAAVAKAYKVYFQKVQEEGAAEDEYFMNHSSIIYLMSPDGEFVAHFTHGTTSDDMAAEIRKHL